MSSIATEVVPNYSSKSQRPVLTQTDVAWTSPFRGSSPISQQFLSELQLSVACIPPSCILNWVPHVRVHELLTEFDR